MTLVRARLSISRDRKLQVSHRRCLPPATLPMRSGFPKERQAQSLADRFPALVDQLMPKDDDPRLGRKRLSLSSTNSHSACEISGHAFSQGCTNALLITRSMASVICRATARQSPEGAYARGTISIPTTDWRARGTEKLLLARVAGCSGHFVNRNSEVPVGSAAPCSSPNIP